MSSPTRGCSRAGVIVADHHEGADGEGGVQPKGACAHCASGVWRRYKTQVPLSVLLQERDDLHDSVVAAIGMSDHEQVGLRCVGATEPRVLLTLWSSFL